MNVTVQCANLVPAPAVGTVTSTDNCAGTATVTHVGDVMSNMTCVNRFNITEPIELQMHVAIQQRVPKQ
jgi:hypothetical protein